MSEKMHIKLNLIELNTGQISGLPKNPRFIRDFRFEKLKKSIREFPEMLELRELIVVQVKDKFVVLGGNMRLRAMRELGHKTAPCKVVDPNTPVEILRRIVITDNNSFGQDDSEEMANEWDAVELEEWGYELPVWEDDEKEPQEKPEENGMIAITLTDDELELWNATKYRLKIKKDKNAFLKLIESYNEKEQD